MCFDYDDFSEFHNESLVRSRKQHPCEGCGSGCQAGHLAQYCTGKYDGNFYSYYICGACMLTIFRIHLHELEEGCSWHESWIRPYDLADYCIDAHFDKSSVAEGQAFMEWKKVNIKVRASREQLVKP